MPIAKASMAAHMQGKFWEFHDLVFQRKAYDDAKLEAIATELGLDVAKWKTDQALPEVEKKILHDQASMVGHGARGTPACFINGKLVSGAKPYDAFKTEVDAALKAADALIAAGTKLEDVHAKLAEKNAKKTFVDAVIMGGTPPKPRPLRIIAASGLLMARSEGAHVSATRTLVSPPLREFIAATIAPRSPRGF